MALHIRGVVRVVSCVFSVNSAGKDLESELNGYRKCKHQIASLFEESLANIKTDRFLKRVAFKYCQMEMCEMKTPGFTASLQTSSPRGKLWQESFGILMECLWLIICLLDRCCRRVVKFISKVRDPVMEKRIERRYDFQ